MHLEKGLVPFWNDFAVNNKFTDATLSVNKPEKAGVVMKLDRPWEGSGSNFFSILRDGDIFRMYYEAWEFPTDEADLVNWSDPVPLDYLGGETYPLYTNCVSVYPFDGDTLSINFRSSARGVIYVKVLDERGNVIKGYESCELFGDSLSRRVDFEKPLSDLHGRKISLDFEMRDCEIFSMRLS